jgi:thiol-disulfide isomerase/thioredoxin
MLSTGSLRTALVIAGLSTSCIEAPSAPARDAAPGSAGRVADSSTPAPAPDGAPVAASTAPQIMEAEPGDVVEVVKRAVDSARADGRTLVVYVGATWCEPCEAFHRAVERGELDAALAGTRFLEFDADVDAARLDAAGYGGRYIPRFVVPTDDGHASAHAVEGGIKGEGAVDHIMKRLGPTLARAAEGR